MPPDLSGRHVVVLGRVRGLSSDEVRLALRDLGAMWHHALRPGVDLVIVAEGATAHLQERARALGLTTLGQDGLLGAIEARRARLAALADAPQTTLEALRALLYEPAGETTWRALLELLDACDEGSLPMAVDYAQAHLERWPTPTRGPDAPLPRAAHPRWRDPRTLSWAVGGGWLRDMLQATRSPKFRLARAVDLSGWRLNGAELAGLLRHPELAGLTALHLGDDLKVSIHAHEALGQLPALETLTLTRMSPRLAGALLEAPGLGGLRAVTLSHSRHTRPEDLDGYRRLFEAPWWSHVEGLCCATSRRLLPRPPWEGIYGALAAHLDQMPALRHLVLSDDDPVEPLIRAGALRRLRRLTFQGCGDETAQAVLDALDRDPEHTVEALDLSRITATPGLYAARPRSATARRHELLLSRVLSLKTLHRLRALTYLEGVTSEHHRQALARLAARTGLTLHAAPERP